MRVMALLGWLAVVATGTLSPVAARPLRPGAVLRECAGCSEMVVLPGGSFLMGSPEAESGRSPSEGPQHRVAIRSFALARFDVTRAQWRRFVVATRRPVIAGCE